MHRFDMQCTHQENHDYLPILLSIFLGYIVVEKDSVRFGPKVEEHDYADLLKKHWPLLLVVLISALVVTLTPIIG